MRSFIFFLLLLFVLNFSAQAQDVAQSSKENQRSSQRNSTVNPLDFFETLVNEDPFHPDNKRDPKWQENKLTELTIDPLEKIPSPKEFQEILKGTWRVLYHCDGAAVLSHKRMYDRKGSSGFLEIEYDGKDLTRYEVGKPDSKENRIKIHGRSYDYELKVLDEGRFEITGKDFDSSIFTLVRIKEAKTFAILGVNSVPGNCPNGKPAQSLQVRTDLPII